MLEPILILCVCPAAHLCWGAQACSRTWAGGSAESGRGSGSAAARGLTRARPAGEAVRAEAPTRGTLTRRRKRRSVPRCWLARRCWSRPSWPERWASCRSSAGCWRPCWCWGGSVLRRNQNWKENSMLRWIRKTKAFRQNSTCGFVWFRLLSTNCYWQPFPNHTLIAQAASLLYFFCLSCIGTNYKLGLLTVHRWTPQQARFESWRFLTLWFFNCAVIEQKPQTLRCKVKWNWVTSCIEELVTCTLEFHMC